MIKMQPPYHSYTCEGEALYHCPPHEGKGD